MDNALDISEVFFGLQGEGRYCGVPALFIRLSGCTRACAWCDTKYHTEGRLYYFEELSAIIDKYLPEIVVWTGGEPLKQYKRIEDFLLTRADVFMVNHIETNGELIASGEITLRELGIFEYVCCSPKELEVAKEVFGVLSSVRDLRMVWDTKVVTDLATVGTDMLQYATMLMPYTSGYPGTDADIRKLVWNYCVEKRLRYSPRLHVEVFGTGKRGI